MVLHYFNGLTCEEVGERLDISLNTVKSRLYRARRRLEQEEPMLRENLSPNLLKNEPRYIGVQATAATETGEHLAEGGFELNQKEFVLQVRAQHISESLTGMVQGRFNSALRLVQTGGNLFYWEFVKVA